ncbi:MAG: BrnT family toxin [Verrucomicrobiales bacterium]
MDFEFDLQKSQINAEKHGIDFEEAQYLWCDERRLVVKARSESEARYALIARYSGKLWTAIFTMREDRIRIISVRRSRHGEEEGYYYS